MLTRSLPACVALALVSACGHVDRQVFVDLDRAAGSMVSALDGKTPLSRYRELLNAYSTELGTTTSRTRSSGDRALVTEYAAVEASLKDLLVVWERRDEEDTELLPIADELPGRLRVEYDLPVNTNEPASIYASEAIRAIADAARTRLRRASETLSR